MHVSERARDLLALCAIRVAGKSPDWSLLARCARHGHLEQMLVGDIPERSPAATKTLPILRAGLEQLAEARARVEEELEHGDRAGARLLTILDEDYPANLALVRDLPPFLFVRGTITTDDLRAVAVVGTRNVSDDGRSRAARMARELVDHGVAITSGLAKGVDTAAHTAALDSGGRTIAVIGTGITRCYPAENKALAERIVDHGALVSQFWPTRAPGRDTFPRRNRVTSGISQGTVVIEASSTSGAKMQARIAAEHGKRVWLIASLVAEQPWAQKMVDEGKATTVATTTAVIADLQAPESVTAQARLDGPGGDQLALDF